MTTFDEEMISNLASDKGLIRGLQNARTVEEANAVFSSYGIDIPVDEFKEAVGKVVNYYHEEELVTETGELTEKGLEMVAGGYRRGGAIAGMATGTFGLLLMMSGPIGWGSIALWAGGCAVAAVSTFI